MHTVQAVAAQRPEHAWVQLDLANAFNSVSRRAALDAVAAHAPALLPMAELFLRRASTFLFLDASGEGVELRATRGVEQGDPWGPFLFALGLPFGFMSWPACPFEKEITGMMFWLSWPG